MIIIDRLEGEIAIVEYEDKLYKFAKNTRDFSRGMNSR
jgi:hypothetical protein